MATEFVGSAEPLSGDGFSQVVDTLGVEPAAVWSVVAVETSGCGFLPDRRPKILFERHIFHRETHGAFAADAPDISNPSAGGYGPSGANQYLRIAKAIALNRTAALHSASWGLGQVMGFNFQSAGFADVESMVAKMMESENEHLLAMAEFIKGRELDKALRLKSWDKFASAYNGPSYKANRYDEKLREFFTRYSAGPTPDLRVRAAQIYLTYLGQDPGPIDGALGNRTRKALTQVGLESTAITDSILEQLKQKAAELT
jgi:hypothetical protein